MYEPEHVEYTVLLVCGSWGDARANAEQIVEAAIQHLNTKKDKPGFRFAHNVFARLEMVGNAEQARTRLETDESLAALILHGLSDYDKMDLTEECARREIQVCHTVEPTFGADDEPPPLRDGKREWRLTFKKKEDNEPHAHTILESVLDAPLDDDEMELQDRVWQVIAVLALSVMGFHWNRTPPRYPVPREE
jgi:hypothetical protein